MDLRKYNNSYIRLTDIDNQKFQGICIFEDKDEYEEEEDGLSIKTEKGWYKIFESEIKSVEIIEHS